MSKKIGVLLSGCGVFDGAEIHEAVITLLALDQEGVEVVCMAPNIDQYKVVNHLNSETVNEKRNVLEESARITRGNVVDVASVSVGDLDGLIIPGGFGAALNSCTFAIDGPDCSVDADVEKIIKAFYEADKPIGAMCIAPALVAKVLAGESLLLTIGSDEATAGAIESLGHNHVKTEVAEVVIDESHKIVTTAAYMLAGSIGEAADGISALVEEVLELVGE